MKSYQNSLIGVTEFQAEKIKHICEALYNGRYPKSIKPFAFLFDGDSTINNTLGQDSNSPNEAYFGTIYGTIAMESTAGNTFSLKIKSGLSLYLSSMYFPGYTGPSVMPFRFSDVTFNYGAVVRTLEGVINVNFNGFVLHF